MPNFDPVAFAVGTGGAISRKNLLSALIGKYGGGGGTTTLEKSGWIKSQGEYTEVVGNTIYLKTGAKTHTIDLAPPVEINPNNCFDAGDVFKIQFSVPTNTARLYIITNANAYGDFESATGYIVYATEAGTNGYGSGTGEDTVVYTLSGSVNYFRIYPAGKSGSASATVEATVEIKGMWYNGTRII